MPLVESLALSVGQAVARALFKIWAGDKEIARDVGISLADIAIRSRLSYRERRGAIRSFERIADDVSAKLAPFLEVEFAALPENEMTAAIRTVQETIESSPLDDSVLMATDLEPTKLEAAFQHEHPRAAEEAHLSAEGIAAYNFLLREVSTYIAEIVITLPAFQSRAARESLARETDLISGIHQILDRLPAAGFGGEGELGALEGQYRREVARKLDRLELFGVRTSEINKRYALSVAYIGLTASRAFGGAAGGKDRLPEGPDRLESTTEDITSSVETSIEMMLNSGRRHLIRGEAGSGKTTLLQWLAVSSARASFEETLDEWNEGLIPFFIQLRRFVDEPFPQPSEFPSVLNPSMGERMPSGWAADVMAQGRALVLVDGVDELKEGERASAAEWLGDMVAAYPRVRYVVTSRPPAVSARWLDDLEFSSSFLEPMELGAIDAFIDHWHKAARAGAGDDDDEKALLKLSSRLQATVRSNSQIRGLATSPLLCAMLCALNRDWNGQLPEDRVELYRVGLDMLLERRDIVRAIPSDVMAISRQQKEVLLQAVAYWLLVNGFSDGKVEDIENLLESKVGSMPKLDADPKKVLNELLLRSGLIREPIQGRVDFIHRTFQEYLAAKQLTDERSVGVIIDHAAEDQWQEVVVLAAGLGNEELTGQLLRGLLDRGQADRASRHRLQLLAVACLETASVLPPDLQKEIRAVLKGLIPPRSMSEAKAIASAGEVAVPLLADHYQGNVSTVAPCIRALSLIGGLDAMATLERFASDRRVTVARELIRAWEFFPTEDYARRVLATSPLDRGKLIVSDPEQLPAVRYLDHLDELSCAGGPSYGRVGWDSSAFAEIPSLRALELTFCEGLSRLPRPKDGGRRLRHLHLSGIDSLDVIDVSGLEELKRLELFRNRGLSRIEGLESLGKLHGIVLTGAKKIDMEGVRLPPTVQDAFVRDLPLADLLLFEQCEQLRVLALSRHPNLVDIRALARCSGLRSLSIADCPSLESIDGLSGLSELMSLDLGECALRESDLGEVPSNLVSFTVSEADFPASVDALPDLPRVDQLKLVLCRGLVDVARLGDLRKLQDVSLLGSTNVESLDGFAGLRELRRLDLEGCLRIQTLEPLYALPELEWVDARGLNLDTADVGRLRDRGVEVLTGPTVSGILARLTTTVG